MRIAVLGCTGKTGEELTRQALERGYEVTAVARHASRLQTRPGLTLLDADARDESALRMELAGSAAVLSAVGSHRRGGDLRVYSDVMRATLAAMRAGGVRRLVCVSAAGVDMERSREIPWLFRVGVIPLLARAEYADMGRMEELVEGSDVDWTIVRPLWLRMALSRGGYVTRCEGPVRSGGGIRREELARFMLDCLGDERWIRQRVWVADGPKKLAE